MPHSRPLCCILRSEVCNHASVFRWHFHKLFGLQWGCGDHRTGVCRSSLWTSHSSSLMVAAPEHWGHELCHWGAMIVPRRIRGRMHPKKLVVLVSAKRNRLHCRGCLGRPLGQLKLSEDCDRRPTMRSSGRLRQWKGKWTWVQRQSKDSRRCILFLGFMTKSETHGNDTYCLKMTLLGARRNIAMSA